MVYNKKLKLYMYEGLYDSGALYFAAHLFVLVDEATQRGVLVANLPPLVNDDCHEHQHHNYHGGGEGYGEDNAYFHTLCDFERKGTARWGNNSLTVGKQSPISRKCCFLAVSKREKVSGVRQPGTFLSMEWGFFISSRP